MKIAIVNGSMRHGSTWHAMDAVVRALKGRGEAEVTEFFLPRDMPHFCTGCFTCFLKGEDKCPHAGAVRPIVGAILGADLVILTSPVYVYDVSGQMKALLDHLGYLWMPHRPDPAMFSKVGLTVVTAAGAGTRRTAGTLRKSLSFLGARRVYSLGCAVGAYDWDHVSAKKKAKIERKAEALAVRIVRAVGRGSRLPYPPFRAILFRLMAGMQKKNSWNETDRAHWVKNGWLDGKRPF